MVLSVPSYVCVDAVGPNARGIDLSFYSELSSLRFLSPSSHQRDAINPSTVQPALSSSAENTRRPRITAELIGLPVVNIMKIK